MCDTATEINITDLSASALTISKPKKMDNSLFAKAKYNNAKLFVYVYNARVVSHKFLAGHGYSTLQVKASQDVVKRFAEIDAHIVANVVANTGVWFNKGIDAGVIDEYYAPSVVVLGNSGTLVKIKLQSEIDQLADGCYDLLLCFKGVRFYKQRFVPEWELVAANMVEDGFFAGEDRASEEEEDDMDIVPREELHQIRLDLEKELDQVCVELNFRKRDVKRALSTLAKLRQEIGDDKDCNDDPPIGSLDKLYENLDEIKRKLVRIS